METVTLKAPDISCEHCVATVQRTALQFPGVQTADANSTSKTVTLTYDPAQTALSDIEAALEDEGYPTQKQPVIAGA